MAAINEYVWFRLLQKSLPIFANRLFLKPFKLRMFSTTLDELENFHISEHKPFHRLPFGDGVALQMSIPSQTGIIDRTVWLVQQQITKFCRDHQIALVNISLYLREALANAIIHGNLEIPSCLKDDCWEQFEALIQKRETLQKFAERQVILRCQMKTSHLTFEIEDEGSGFDINQVQASLQDELLELAEHNPIDLSSSGRGLLIILAFMDHVRWNEHGNCITMIKNLESM